jgi:NAD-dependent dihydropyrimidine dehydrogenase PreA subunit
MSRYFINLLCHVHPLLGKDRETINQKRPLLGNRLKTATEERCFLCGLCRDVISGTSWELELVAWRVSKFSQSEE